MGFCMRSRQADKAGEGGGGASASPDPSPPPSPAAARALASLETASARLRQYTRRYSRLRREGDRAAAAADATAALEPQLGSRCMLDCGATACAPCVDPGLRLDMDPGPTKRRGSSAAALGLDPDPDLDPGPDPVESTRDCPAGTPGRRSWMDSVGTTTVRKALPSCVEWRVRDRRDMQRQVRGAGGAAAVPAGAAAVWLKAGEAATASWNSRRRARAMLRENLKEEVSPRAART